MISERIGNLVRHRLLVLGRLLARIGFHSQLADDHRCAAQSRRRDCDCQRPSSNRRRLSPRCQRLRYARWRGGPGHGFGLRFRGLSRLHAGPVFGGAGLRWGPRLPARHGRRQDRIDSGFCGNRGRATDQLCPGEGRGGGIQGLGWSGCAAGACHSPGALSHDWQPLWALWILAIATHLTALTRILHVWRASLAKSTPIRCGRLTRNGS